MAAARYAYSVLRPPHSVLIFSPLPQRGISLSYTVGIIRNYLILLNIKVIKIEKNI